MAYAEVYAGSRPGRPRALLVLTAALLGGTLLLAWWQARAARGLGPERAIPDTPLLVRPPADWVASPKDPRAFLLRSQVHGRRGERWEVDRYVRFDYERLGAFQPPAEALQALGYDPESLEPARIGKYAAVQLRRVEHRRWGRRVARIESVVRAAILPAGQLITVQYVPMTELTPADLELLDEICAHVRLSDPALATTPQEAEARAGLTGALPPDAQVALAELPEVPGFYLGGTAEGLPAWSFGLFRTWLAGDRTPRDLLLDFAATTWLLSEEVVEVQESRRTDGATLAHVTHPDPGRNRRPVAAAWVLAEGPREALLLFVYTNEDYLAAADAAAQALLEQTRIEPLDAIPNVATAEQAGVELARLFTARGAMPWWGRLGVQLHFRGETLRGEEYIVIQRQARGRGTARGYQGHRVRSVRARKYEEPTSWQLGPHAATYLFETALYWDENVRILVRERRGSGDEPVVRDLTVNDVERRVRSFVPGLGFICPPLESLAEAWTAREAAGPCLVEVSTLLGRGTHTRLLRPLPTGPDAHQARVLVQADFHPFGVIVTVDEDYEVVSERSAYARYERVRPRAP